MERKTTLPGKKRCLDYLLCLDTVLAYTNTHLRVLAFYMTQSHLYSRTVMDEERMNDRKE